MPDRDERRSRVIMEDTLVESLEFGFDMLHQSQMTARSRCMYGAWGGMIQAVSRKYPMV